MESKLCANCFAELQPGANVVEQGLSISRNSVTDAQSDVENWVAGLGF